MSITDWRKLTVHRLAGLSLIFILLAAADANAQHRVALVIGNSDYRNVDRLSYPEKDATAMAKLFRDAGFDTVVADNNVGNLDFKRAILKFEKATVDSDIAVVFYAGHGIEIGGTNYLVPIDAKLATDGDAQDEAITLDSLVASGKGAKQLRLIILDANRDNPLAKTMKHTMASRANGYGLTRVEPAGTDTLIAYATKAGSTAEDGNREHSPFTTALLANLTVPGLDVRLAFGRVRDQVMKITDRRQEPFVYGALGGGAMAIVPASSSSVAAQNSSANGAVKSDYELVTKIGTKEAWEVFLQTYPTGFYAEIARAQLARLRDKNMRVSNAPSDSKSCLLHCIGDWLTNQQCDAAGDVCIEMARASCAAIIDISVGKCGPGASRKLRSRGHQSNKLSAPAK